MIASHALITFSETDSRVFSGEYKGVTDEREEAEDSQISGIR